MRPNDGFIFILWFFFFAACLVTCCSFCRHTAVRVPQSRSSRHFDWRTVVSGSGVRFQALTEYHTDEHPTTPTPKNPFHLDACQHRPKAALTFIGSQRSPLANDSTQTALNKLKISAFTALFHFKSSHSLHAAFWFRWLFWHTMLLLHVFIQETCERASWANWQQHCLKPNISFLVPGDPGSGSREDQEVMPQSSLAAFGSAS